MTGSGEMNIIQCTAGVMWNCAPEICIILLTSFTPINSIKKEKEIEKGRNGKINLFTVKV